MASGAADVGLDELQTRLETFTQQLESIHELLQSDPQNDEFLGIAQDLVEVIRLTKEMVLLSRFCPCVSTAHAAAQYLLSSVHC
jgi:hypothetical protein